MQKLINKLNKMPKVKSQILRIFFVAGVLPMLIFGIFSVIQVRNQMNEQYESLIKADGLRVNSVMFDITTTLYTSTESITTTEEYMKLFASEEMNGRSLTTLSNLNENLSTFRKNTAAISLIHIYTNNPAIPNQNYISYVPDLTETEWYDKIQNEWSTWTCLTNHDILGNAYTELALVKRIAVASTDYSAYLVLQLDNNYLRNRIEQSDNQVAISIDTLPVFYASDRKLLDSEMTFPDEFTSGYCKYTGGLCINDSTVLSNICTFQPYKTNNLFYIRTSDFSAYESINHITLVYVILILVSILVPTIVILIFSSYFSSRINALKNAMHKARVGDYNIIDQFNGDDELKETFEDLKATVEIIHEKEAKYYQAQITEQQLINRQQQMEFEMLASQINPHFLYNTLETIRMQALSSGNREVATSIKLLGKSMHYVLENTGTSFTTLTRELDYIKTYLAIQQMRFGDRVNGSIQIAEDLDTDEYRILPLLLQPIVENAIIHGLENMDEDGHINIALHTTEDFLLIKISDNGCGMTEEELSNLKRRIKEHDPKDTRSIGLYNIDQRIHLFYGTEYGMEIESCPGKGTFVTLRLPRFFTAQTINT